jgi:malonate decarboxylase beta subunit
MTSAAELLSRHSFIELDARARVRALIDAGSFRELIDPFERMTSPWLARQGVVTQSDDGVVVAKGTLAGRPTVMLAIEGAFQGGSLGEVGGAKIAGALELAAADNRNGTPTGAVILFETGGVRLQEANLGLAAIAEIHSAIVDLRRYQPVIGVIAGTVGCFGGMSIAAGLCSYLVVTREARLGLNGPQVIEQEAGVDEYDSRDRPFIWSLSGGEQRYRTGLVDAYVDDDVDALRASVIALVERGRPAAERSDAYAHALERLSMYDPDVQVTPEIVRRLFAARESDQCDGTVGASDDQRSDDEPRWGDEP